jgi:hypothetical protein
MSRQNYKTFKMKLLKSTGKGLQIGKKISYAAALLMLTFSACKKENGYASLQADEVNEEVRFSSTSDLTSAPPPTVYFMDRRDLYSVTNLHAVKPTVTKKWTMDTKYDEHFNNNDNHTSNTYAYNFKTNEIFSLDYNDNDNDLPYLFKSSVNKNSVTETKTTVKFVGGGMEHVRINPADGKVFYVAGSEIWKMDANGTNNQIVVPFKLSTIIRETDIDFKKQLFYYIDGSIDGSLNVCGVNGQNNKILTASPFGDNMVGSQVRLDLKKSKVYFSTASDTQKKFRIWSIATSGDITTLKNEFEKSYTDTWSAKFTFDVVPSLNKIVWSLHERLSNGRILEDVSVLGRLNLTTGVSDILYQGGDINCTVAVNP